MDLSPGLEKLKNVCNLLRGEIKDTAAEVAALKRKVGASDDFNDRDPLRLHEEGDPDRGETIANVTLAYRHLEDASMRLGKAIQAIDGGRSVYDPKTTVGA